MPLRLTVANSAGETPVVERTKEFDHRGGTIGRADDNTWVLPDRIVSGLHAEIESRGDEFWIIDRSTNGTFVDDAEDPIGKGREQRLHNGARLRIGHYEIAVMVVAKEPQRRSTPQGSGESGLNGVVPTEDIFNDFPDKPERPIHPAALPSQPNRGRPERQNFPPRPITPPTEQQRERGGGNAQPGGLIPPDIANRFRERKKGGGRAPPEEVRAPEPSPGVRKQREVDPEPANAQRRHSADAGVASMLEAAGLDRAVARAAASDSALVAELGRALAVAVRSVIKTLDTRADIKREFGLPVTEYRAESNNPLKCSETVKEALDKLVLRENSPYMAPYEAFEEAAKDISEHQVAVIAAMRSAFKSMLAEFEPQALERRYEEQNKQAALLKMGGKGRYWDLYKEHYQRVAGDSRTSFQKLFGQQFATAYWEALKGGRS